MDFNDSIIDGGLDALPFDVFRQFMECSTVDRLRAHLAAFVRLERYEHAAVCRDLIAERTGKAEVWTERNVPAYF